MKICLVTTFPPSTGGLSEYGFHIAQQLQRNPFLNLTVLADELSPEHVEPEGFNVVRCWSFDDPGSVFRLLKTLHRLKPDVVWFNLLFSTFGRNPLVAFSGLMTPLLARLSGRYTHVTLHHLMDTVELKDAGVRHEGLYRFAGAVATRMLLLSNSVSVLMPGYRKILNDKYGRDNVHLRAHGILARRPEFPDFARRGNPIHRILAFGKWGTYKRLELMIDAFKQIADRLPEAKLVIAGGDHPQARGYTESVKRQCAGNARIEFRGYVPEDALPDLFQSSSVAVMPYSSSTGCSGVAHLACAYGVPIVSADLPDFRQMALGEELAIQFYPAGNAQGLADCLFDFLQNPEQQQKMAVQNFSAALRMTMPNVVQKYLRHFELQQRVQTLRNISRFRRLPRWMPSKSLLLRLVTRNSLGWARRTAVLHTGWNGSDDFLPHGNGDGRGQLDGIGNPLNGDGVTGSHRAGSYRAGSVDRAGAGSAAGRGTDNHRSQNTSSQNGDDALALHLSDQSQPEQTETEEPSSEQGIVPFAVVRGGNARGGNGKNGADGTATGSNGSGRKRTGESLGQSGAGQGNGAIESA
jgi:glycosyltransferase involved in cell wall biosynthesis